MPNPNRKKLAGRSQLARIAHFRGGAGAMGGNRKQQAKRRRLQDRLEERQTPRDPREQGE